MAAGSRAVRRDIYSPARQLLHMPHEYPQICLQARPSSIEARGLFDGKPTLTGKIDVQREAENT